jgi:hypothetical protein
VMAERIRQINTPYSRRVPPKRWEKLSESMNKQLAGY